MNTRQLEATKQWWLLFRREGLNPLPCSLTEKRPKLTSYSHFFTQLAPEELFDHRPSTNLQIPCGINWNLAVLDLDNPDPSTRSWALNQNTWISLTGGGGIHLWYKIPREINSIQSQVKLPGENHSAWELLGSKKLVVAPPSQFPGGHPYRWLSRKQSPLGCKRQTIPESWIAPEATRIPPKRFPDFDWSKLPVLALARSWGLRIVGNPNQKGWAPCKAINREDSHPSAAIHCETGYYVDLGTNTKLDFLDLAIALKIASTRKEALKLCKN